MMLNDSKVDEHSDVPQAGFAWCGPARGPAAEIVGGERDHD
jgi:hypothetical protein